MKSEMVCGVDEAGRGPLVGNVVAAAVVLPEGGIEGLRDSKKLGARRREALFDQIIGNAVAWGIGMASPAEIDEVNILQATLLAMRRAVEALGMTELNILVDGNRLPDLSGLSVRAAEAIVKGDDKVTVISAASILAKVTRDRQMVELDRLYPRYGFARHQGYPTAAHLQALQDFGPCPEHRRTFGPVKSLYVG